MVGVGGSSPLGRTKFLNKNSTLWVLFLFVLFIWKNKAFSRAFEVLFFPIQHQFVGIKKPPQRFI